MRWFFQLIKHANKNTKAKKRAQTMTLIMFDILRFAVPRKKKA